MELTKEYIQKRQNEYLEYISETTDKKNQLYRNISNMKRKYIQDKYDIEKGSMFVIDNKRYAVDYMSIFDSLEPNDIFLNCSTLLKSGKWSKRLKIFTLDQLLED